MKTVIGLYDDFNTAQKVVQEMVANGFDRNNISLVANNATGEYDKYVQSGEVVDSEDVSVGEGATVGAIEGGLIGLLAGLGAMAIPGIGPVLAAGPLLGALTGAGVGAITGGILAGLVDLGVPEDDAHFYAEGIRRGGTLVTVHADDNQIENAVAIMNRYGAIDIDQRADTWRERGWTGYNANAKPLQETELRQERETYRNVDRDTSRTMDKEGRAVVPEIQEELKVSKRVNQASGGGVRVHTHVTEVPVEEQIRLRKEHVQVEHRDVNRPVTNEDMANLRDGTIEVTEMSEEAVISKEARVTGEVVINKEVVEDVQTIRDTVRRTEVEVDQINTDMDRDYSNYSTRFRNHYTTTYPSSRYSYEQYEPAYRYGYTLANDTRYRGRDWNTFEADARTGWESDNDGPWDDFKDAVRHGWNEVRQEVDKRF
ncbi:MAG: YsnF/AvaK domain-containing protein [Ardenticatenales bacterium]|nr:YsnF/AvaK domain-containing protein [Ardenticatenales bacterium]